MYPEESRRTYRGHVLRILAVLFLLASGLMASASSIRAQGATSDIAVVTTENGSTVYDACYVLVNQSNVGCDENGDGKITFEDIPLGTYTLRQTVSLGSGRSVPDSTINVTGQTSGDGWEYFYVSVITGGGSTTGVTSQVAIFSDQNGQPAYDACYVLVGYSLEGCDENRDGRVMFADIPWGTYTVRQTADLGPNRRVADFTIQVRGNVSSAGWEGFSATIINTSGTGSPSDAIPVDIALITRAPEDGHLLTDTCYVLVGYSNEGCDENGDGQVTFAAIPPGTYTVQQTKTPAGYPAVKDFDIYIPAEQALDMGFVVRQGEVQNAPDTRNISIVFVDTISNRRIPITNICAELVNGSNVGCDSDLKDGQIDFLDVPEGEYTLNITGLTSCQWYAERSQGELRIKVDAGMGQHTIVNYPVYVTPACEGAGNPAVPTAASNADWAPMDIGASGPNGWEIGAVFTVTLADGTYIGTCTLEGQRHEPVIQSCRVSVPRYTTVVVTLDTNSISPGLVPSENPMRFGTSGNPGAASHWGLSFKLVPAGQ